MGTQVGPLLSFNRGVLSRTTLARTDLDRTRLSAEIMTNWLPKTQGPMILRPGTKYLGSSLRDTGAAWVEFVASTDDFALLELTGGDTGTTNKMRVWLPSDTGHAWETPVADGLLVPMSRPAVNTTVTLSDTGWANVSTGGAFATPATDVIPAMTGPTTSGVRITASSENTSSSAFGDAWNAADNDNNTEWHDTGAGHNSLPSWWNVNFDTGGNDTGLRRSVRSYSIRASSDVFSLDNAPRAWRLITGNFDTGTFATDTGKWTLEDERSAQKDWSSGQKRTYSIAAADTGTIEARRHWRLYFTAVDTGVGASSLTLQVAEIEMFDAATAQQVKLQGGTRVLNATSIGARAIARKRVVVSDTGTEHSLAIQIGRGPVTLRVGASEGDDDYISETSLGSGYHNLAFTPQGNFWIDLRTDGLVDRIVSSLTIGDSGTVEVTTPWTADDIDNVRFDQSADVIYVDCDGVQPHKIERRGTGRSWSVVKYDPSNGPFMASRTSSAKIGIGQKYGNTALISDIPFFSASQVGALFRVTHEGQSGKWLLGAVDAKTEVIEVTGISDTGVGNSTNERRIVFAVTGTYSGRIIIERSFDDPDFGFKQVTDNYVVAGGGSASDTGTFTTTIDDKDDNITVFYRARLSTYSSGVAVINATYKNGSVTGTARVTGFNNNQSVNVEVLEQFSDTGPSDNWLEGAWSSRRGYPTAVALHEGRLTHAGSANIWLSVSDDYENFDDTVVGEAGPISRTLGSGPVDIIRYLVSLLRLVAGTTGSEIAIKSSSLDESLTPTNTAARAFSTQGSASLRALKMDSKALFVQRSRERLYMVGFGSSADSISDYSSTELTILVPDFLRSGVVSIAIQRQPDTRIHCVLGDGTVAILTYEPQEEVLAWSKWVTDTGSNSAVERAMVLPGAEEDQVFYHIRRTINGVTRRFLEKWAMESECRGDTGLSWLMDCAVSQTDTGSALVIPDFAPHLAGQTIAAWANDTGQNNSVGRDLTPDDTGGTQVLLSLDTGGDLTLNDSGPKHIVGGLSYRADFKSTKLAYGATGTTAMTMMKRVDRLSLILDQTHNNALFAGSDTGNLDPMPRVTNEGAAVDANAIYPDYDRFSFPFNGDWDEDSRLFIRAKAPRPATIMAALPSVTTNER